MLKYVDTKVVFQEVPDEITLAINISNCPCHCINCHSSYLAEDIGEPLDLQHLTNLIKSLIGSPTIKWTKLFLIRSKFYIIKVAQVNVIT